MPKPNNSDSENELHHQGAELEEGDEVLFNDRSRPLRVTGEHKRRNSSKRWRSRGESEFYTVIELEGNGTEYHLLCNPGSSIGPMLYKEADWDEEKEGSAGESPRYSRTGERVKSMEIANDD